MYVKIVRKCWTVGTYSVTGIFMLHHISGNIILFTDKYLQKKDLYLGFDGQITFENKL